MADQANAPAAQTPPPTAPEGSAPSAVPAPSNAPVGLALDLPGKFGPGWTVSGTDREGNVILSKPSGDGVTTMAISQQTLDRAKQLTWNRNRKPSKQKLSRRSVQFNGIHADVKNFDAHRNRYLMSVQDAEGRTVTKWVDAKTAEKLNNKDIEAATEDFAKDLGVKTDATLNKEKTKPKEKTAKGKPTKTEAPKATTSTPEKNAEVETPKKEPEKEETIDHTEEFVKKMKDQGYEIDNERIELHKKAIELMKAEGHTEEEEKEIVEKLNSSIALHAMTMQGLTNLKEKVEQNNELKNLPSQLAELGKHIGKTEREKEEATERKSRENETQVTQEATELEIPKRLEDLDPFLRDSKLVGDEKATKLLTRVKSLQALQAAPTPDAIFTQITKGTTVENLAKMPAANDPKRREYNRYQDLAKQIYEAHRTRLRDTEEVSFEAEEFLKDVAREGKTVDQIIKEREFDQHYEAAVEEARERQENTPEAAGAAALGGAIAAGTGVALASRAQPTSPNIPSAGAIESAILPSVSELAAGLVAGAGTAGVSARSSAPRPTASGSSGAAGSVSVSARSQTVPSGSATTQAGGSTQVSGSVNVKSTINLTQQTERTVSIKGGGGTQNANIEVTVTPEAGTAPAAQPAPPDSVGSTVSFLRAQNRDRFASPPPVGPIGKAVGVALAIGAVPLGAMLGGGGSGGGGGSAPRPGRVPGGIQAPVSKSGSLRVSLPGIPAPQQLRVEQYVRSSTNLNQRETQLEGFEQQYAPILEEYDSLLSIEDRSPAQESRLQQIQAEHGDTILRPRELLQNQVQAGRDNVASLKQAGAKEGFDIPALAAPFMPSAAPAVPQAISPSAPSAETVAAALPTPKPPGKQTGIPSTFRPAGGRIQPTNRGPGGGLRGGAGGMAKLGSVLPSRPAGNPVSQFAQAQQQDRMGGEDARESSLGSEGGSGQSPIETIPQTYGAEPTREKSERQRQSEMMATQRQMTGGMPQEAGEKLQVGGITIERKAATEAERYKQMRDENQRQRGASITQRATNQPPSGNSFTQQALQKYGGAAGAAAGLAANSGIDVTAQAKKQIRRVKWELLLSIEGSPLYFLAGAAQFFGKMGLGKYMPEELKTEWWEDLLCGTLFLAICLAIFIVLMFLFALLSGFVIFIDPRQYANAALRWAGL